MNEKQQKFLDSVIALAGDIAPSHRLRIHHKFQALFNPLPKPTVEVQNTKHSFLYRLVSAVDGRATNWTDYTGIATIDGYATATDYYLGDGTHFPIMPVDEFMELVFGTARK